MLLLWLFLSLGSSVRSVRPSAGEELSWGENNNSHVHSFGGLFTELVTGSDLRHGCSVEIKL